METIAVYTTQKSSRLTYVLDWLLKERLHTSYTIITNEAEASALPFCLAYGAPLPNSISIPDGGLLWQQGTEKVTVETGNWQDIPTLFANGTAGYSLPFDLLSALFFLLSRYEEYYAFEPDKHGRYPATSSIMYRQGWLLRPLADEWVHAFKKVLRTKHTTLYNETHFLYQPTYDIDMAYSHLHKGATRIIGAYMRALLKMDVGQINERTKVLKKKQKDPYDSFRWLRQLHKAYDYKPLYFVLSAEKTTDFDKNIHPGHPAMMRVIKNLAREGATGIHPSYYSDKGDMMSNEKQLLERVTGRSIHISRQHYIRVKTPDTYRLLLQNGIAEDYSMGYGSHLGFRAGTGNSFYWYDLQNETTTRLRIHPFCFMDTTAYYEAKLTAAEAFEMLELMCRRLQQTGSVLITIFHNFSLGTSAEWKGWRQAYERFLEEKSMNHAVHIVE